MKDHQERFRIAFDRGINWELVSQAASIGQLSFRFWQVIREVNCLKWAITLFAGEETDWDYGCCIECKYIDEEKDEEKANA